MIWFHPIFGTIFLENNYFLYTAARNNCNLADRTLRRLAGESILPRLELDISDNHIPRAVGRIADWMESTAGCG